MKKCKGCEINKSKSEFYFNEANTTADKLSVRCKDCHNKQQALWRDRNPKYMTKYALRNRTETMEKYGVSVKTIERHGLETVMTAYENADRKCSECESEKDLTIHHKDHNGRNKMDSKEPVNNNLDNLTILCRSCHGRLHSIERWANRNL